MSRLYHVPKLRLPQFGEADFTVWALIYTGLIYQSASAGDLADEIHYSEDLRELDDETNLTRQLCGFVGIANDIFNILTGDGDAEALSTALRRLHVYAKRCPPLTRTFVALVKHRDPDAMATLAKWRSDGTS